MKRTLGLVMLAVTLASCRDYDLGDRLGDQSGLTPPDQFARYGTEQAQAIAIARTYGQGNEGSSYEDLVRQAEAAASYARTLPGVVDVRTDPRGLRLTVQFRSGWRTAVIPIDDGKRGAETAGLPAGSTPER